MPQCPYCDHAEESVVSFTWKEDALSNAIGLVCPNDSILGYSTGH